MHFFSGGFGLLAKLPDGTGVDAPLAAIPSLDATHPYAKIGAENIEKYAKETKRLFCTLGINVEGTAEQNRYVISASGAIKPAWLTIDDIASVSAKDEKIADNALIVNIDGFLIHRRILRKTRHRLQNHRCDDRRNPQPQAQPERDESVQYRQNHGQCRCAYHSCQCR